MKYIKKYSLALTLSFLSITVNAQTRNYEAPPSSSTRGHVPWIPDSQMEQCVKLYNEAKWLGEEIDSTTVNQYNHASVDSYNLKVDRHSKMIDFFNQNCAGKQSESAYKAAQKLNSQNR